MPLNRWHDQTPQTLVTARSQLFIRDHRKFHNVSLTELAKGVGKSKGMISQIENGRSGASQETLEDIAEFFGLKHVGLLFEPPIPEGYKWVLARLLDENDNSSAR